MNRNPAKRSSSKTNLVLLSSLFAIEISGALIFLCVYKKGSRPLLSFLTGPTGVYFTAAITIFIISSALIYQQHRKRIHSESKTFIFTVIMNLITVVIFIIIGEVFVRTFSVTVNGVTSFMNISLLPRSWNLEANRNRELLRKVSDDGTWIDSFFVYDGLLGWTIGSNRQSADGMNFSSTEGIRGPRSNWSFAETQVKRRIALVGDSYTYGIDVKYEDSWGYRLEQMLGPDFQVLNFGVDGYGLDQALLRYKRDVRPWQPDVVILGFIEHDLYRTITVYSFVSFPTWQRPFSKPRFILQNKQLKLLNVPLLTPEKIFTIDSISKLPIINYDPGYNDYEWKWRAYHSSFLIRFVVSKFPRYPVRNLDGDIKSINGSILRTFIKMTRDENSIPLVVYFPTRGAGDFPSKTSQIRRGLAREILQEYGIEYIDLTACLTAVKESERFVYGKPHYSPTGNAAVSKCLYTFILERLS